ncbi:sulfatase [Parabacteroides sp. OttesenSCG-928-G06]|nr:sulfatase [Parabacteroides sp. OttesenSCG-928-G06]
MKHFEYAVGCLVLPMLFPTLLKAEQPTSTPPNILLIMIDDLGWSDVGYNGSLYYETPHIDALQSKAISFHNGYAAASNSAPSRASLMTGLYTPRHGVYTVDPPDRGRAEDRKLIPAPNKKVLDPEMRTLPMVLKSKGYQTCHIGKWHVGTDPLLQGMDLNIAGNHAGHPGSYFSPYKNPNLSDGEPGEYLMDRLAEEAVNYLDTVSGKQPFFLYYATYAVHTPLQAKPELIEKYQQKEKTAAHNNPVYAAMVENMDACVGRVLDALEKNGLAENTLVIFTSDNGGVYNISRQWPLRAGKGSFYEGGIREPFLVYQKGKYEGGITLHTPVSHLDLLPTFVELAGINNKEMILDGESLLPLLEKGETDYLTNRTLYWHFPAYLEGGNEESRDPIFRSRPVSVIRKGDWKLIENYEDNTLELYNLKEDPSETKDLASSYSRERRELYSQLNKWKKETKALLPRSATSLSINK